MTVKKKEISLVSFQDERKIIRTEGINIKMGFPEETGMSDKFEIIVGLLKWIRKTEINPPFSI